MLVERIYLDYASGPTPILHHSSELERKLVELEYLSDLPVKDLLSTINQSYIIQRIENYRGPEPLKAILTYLAKQLQLVLKYNIVIDDSELIRPIDNYLSLLIEQNQCSGCGQSGVIEKQVHWVRLSCVTEDCPENKESSRIWVQHIADTLHHFNSTPLRRN